MGKRREGEKANKKYFAELDNESITERKNLISKGSLRGSDRDTNTKLQKAMK